MTAARIPDLIFGRTTVKNVPNLLAPRLSAATSMEKSKFDKLEEITRMMKGSMITVCPTNRAAYIGS